MIRRGDIRWFRFSIPDKRRPVLILTPDDRISQMNQIVVVPLSTRVRGVDSEVILATEDGLPTLSVLKPEWVKSVERADLGALIARLPESRWNEVRRAVMDALGFAE